MKNRHNLFFFLIILLSICIIAFTELSSLLIENIRIDSIGHLIGFFFLTWILHSAIKLPLLNTTICLIFYAALSEIGQYYLGFGNGEVRDVIADIVGVLLFILLHWITMISRKKSSYESIK